MRPKARLGILLICALVVLSSAVCSAKVVYVKTTGLDTNDGLSWDAAKKTVQGGINASVAGDEIWVAAGTYVQCITLKLSTGLYGGFAGTEMSRDQRNANANVTVLDGSKSGSVVTVPLGATPATMIDGFTIRNGNATFGGGIRSYDSPTIANNTITGNTAVMGGGIDCSPSSAAPNIVNNIIAGNTVEWHGAGIYCQCAAKVISNTISRNTAGSDGGGLFCSYYAATVTNNTIVNNIASRNGGGVFSDYCATAVTNNVIAFNSSGIYQYAGPPVLRSNCVYGNSGHDYVGLSPGTGDISDNPLFVDPDGDDYHLQVGSPCVEAGYDAAVQQGWLDVDGQSRILSAHVDIGADESDGVWRTVGPTLAPVSGCYSSPQDILITCVTPGAVVHYTTNGFTPTDSDPVANGTIHLDANATLKAKAWKVGWAPSCTKTATYTFTTAMPTFSPTAGAISSALNVTIACLTPDAVVRYTTSGFDPTESDPITADPVLVSRGMTLKAKAWRTGCPSSPVNVADYVIVPLSDPKRQASGSAVTIYAPVVTATPSTTQFYVEADDRSCGIMVMKSGHGLTVGKRVDIQGTLTTPSTGEKYLNATSIADRGAGSIRPLMLTNREIGGGDWFYDAATGAGQRGMRTYRMTQSGRSTGTFPAVELNNIGMLITTSGKVTYSTSGYFYIDDGSGLLDSSGKTGIKVLGAVPAPSPLPPGWTPVGHYVTVTGISTCFKAASPSTDLFRQIRATLVTLVN